MGMAKHFNNKMHMVHLWDFEEEVMGKEHHQMDLKKQRNKRTTIVQVLNCHLIHFFHL
jgi:hypothetical protein